MNNLCKIKKCSKGCPNDSDSVKWSRDTLKKKLLANSRETSSTKRSSGLSLAKGKKSIKGKTNGEKKETKVKEEFGLSFSLLKTLKILLCAHDRNRMSYIRMPATELDTIDT